MALMQLIPKPKRATLLSICDVVVGVVSRPQCLFVSVPSNALMNPSNGEKYGDEGP